MPNRHAEPAAKTATRTEPLPAGAATGDAVADAQATALLSGRKPTPAELARIKEQDDAAKRSRTHIGEVRIAPNSAV